MTGNSVKGRQPFKAKTRTWNFQNNTMRMRSIPTADVWKSQPRKRCEYCDCWFADNKASRDFHEQGKRHQNNVRKKLDDLRKKGAKDAEEADAEAKMFQNIEMEALKAYQKDINTHPGMMSAEFDPNDYINYDGPSMAAPPPELLPTIKPLEPEPPKKPEEIEEQKKKRAEKRIRNKEKPIDHYKKLKAKDLKSTYMVTPSSVWQIAHTEKGRMYYWNTETNEVSWNAPDVKAVLEYDEATVSSRPQKAPGAPSGEPAAYPSTVQAASTASSASTVQAAVDIAAPALPDIDDIPLPGAPKEAPPPAPLNPWAGSAPALPQKRPTYQHPALPRVQAAPVVEGPSLPNGRAPEVIAPAPVRVEEPAKDTRKRPADEAYGNWHTPKPKKQEDEVVDLQLPVVQPKEELVSITLSEPKFKIREKKVDKVGQGLAEFRKRKKMDRNLRN
ncbi:hypothetical protein CAPTEDRAFT_222399 [Capitella teleta]|uniref:WW domain-binding protein 4 n=1 Tax=Capitella teleta TaxID=283909 RepID=R7TDC3_CAPTE|nr:hypothetical protein CAPTEDRAFT_222399 [Capitella teleta]|eukprot:ELT89487.1 hypothetical protein CAPTEDRAFT_222399 [Capitella teleta]